MGSTLYLHSGYRVKPLISGFVCPLRRIYRLFLILSLRLNPLRNLCQAVKPRLEIVYICLNSIGFRTLSNIDTSLDLTHKPRRVEY